MPPKKKHKTSPVQAESLATPSDTPASNEGGKPRASFDPVNDPVNDPWTDEQETALLKGIIKWKPVGE